MELAFDFEFVDDGLNLVDCGTMTLDREPCSVRSMPSFNFRNSVVDGIRQMGRRDAGHSAGERPILQHNDFFTGPAQQIRRREPRNSASHDADVGFHVFG